LPYQSLWPYHNTIMMRSASPPALPNKHALTPTVLGVVVDCRPASDILDSLENQISQGQTAHVVTLNPEMLMQANVNPALKQCLQQADYGLPDGAGVVWALKRQGQVVKRLPGIEFSDNVVAMAHRLNWPVALIGASPTILPQTVDYLKAKYPGLVVSFSHHGFFDDPNTVMRACVATKPQVLLMALGVPKQELLLAQWRQQFADNGTGCVLIGVGGSFDVWAGVVKRAPLLWQRLNLEWLYRLLCQPQRWTRLVTTLPLFVVKVLLT
jgi:N-acetylglucosaminyldiphosphoundecaprenol N-acetyl-beta-D-mannosaminyltransferase